MGFWTRLLGDHAGITPNANPPSTPPTVGVPDYTPGDPDGFELEGEETFSRSLSGISPSPWDGWPAGWSTPNWQSGLAKLVDTAWTCLDLNSSVLSTMPVYRTQSGRILDSTTWMTNPDPTIYASWEEFAKQLFWDYQMGEAFIFEMTGNAAGFPAVFRVIPPWLVNVEFRGNGFREYKIGGEDVTDRILHIRYKSTTDNARGIGPLDAGGARMIASELLTRYIREVAETGGVTAEWITVEKQMSKAQVEDLRAQYVTSRQKNPGYPAIMAGGAELNQAKPVSAKDLALLELAQFTESRIAVMCGVPPFLVGLPSGDSMTYSNVTSLFDFHDRSSLRPKAKTVMSALSGWALPRGQHAELNRDEYSRPALNERAEAYDKLFGIGAISVEEIRTMERLTGDTPEQAPSQPAAALTGGDD